MTDSAAARRTAWPVFAAAVIVALAVGVTLLVGRDSGRDPFSLASSATIPSGHAHDAVVHDGDSVRGQGTVVAPAGGPVRFCAPVAAGSAAHAGSAWFVAVDCPVSIRATGVDLSQLTRTRRVGGTVVGSAALTGTYRDGTLHVTHQSAYVEQPGLFGDEPPCPAPENGWPDAKGDPDLSAVSRYRAAHPGSIEIAGLLRPSRKAVVVYVVTATDPNPVGDALTGRYGERLCVVRGRYSPTQLARARQAVTARIGAGPRLTTPFGGGGPTLTKTGEVKIDAGVPIIDDAFASVVDAQPAGLVQVDVWLRPTG